MSYVLCVDDNEDMRLMVREVLQSAGHETDLAADGLSALASIQEREPDLLVLDLVMPGMSGLDVCRAVKLNPFTARIPILMLTAQGDIKHKVAAFEAGADDYLAKPFEYAELLARVKALLRRSTITAGSSTMRVRDLSVDPVARRVERAGKVIELTQKEYALLEYLVRNSGRVVSRQMISEHVWKHDVDPLTNVVDVYINYLRKKLDEDKNNPLIQTVRGRGYLVKD